MKSLWIVALIVVSVALTQHIPTASACSGSSADLGEDYLSQAEILIKATVLDADPAGNSAVLRVEDYYKGEGERFITVMRYSPALTSGALYRVYDTSCLYAGRGTRWLRGVSGYFALVNNGNGTFVDLAHYYVDADEIFYRESNPEGYVQEYIVTRGERLPFVESEIIEEFLDHGGRETPIRPTMNRYPLPRFVDITTEQGTRYQINPDRSVIRLPEDAPIAISPDGAHVAFREGENIVLRYIWTQPYSAMANGERDDVSYASLTKPGRDARFSNDSNFVVVWNEETLSIFLITNMGWSLLYDYGAGMELLPLGNVTLKPTQNGELPNVAWSADSSTVAWVDGSGVWRWNIIEMSEPQQVAGDSQRNLYAGADVLELSSRGRYVRIGHATDWTLVDSATGEHYENALISDREQTLI